MNTKTISYYLKKGEISATQSYKENKKEMVETFHENTKISHATRPLLDRSIFKHLFNGSYILSDSRNNKNYFLKPEAALPKAKAIDMSFDTISEKRTSSRNFNSGPLTDQELSDLLASLRITRRHTSDLNKNAKLAYRTYASAGALYPIEIYILLPNQDHTAWSAMYYSPKKHTLTTIHTGITPEIISEYFQDYSNMNSKSGAIVLLTGIFERSLDKYGPLGYRFSLLEAGGILQQLGLASAGMGLGSLVWGGTYDNEINKLLKIDGVNEAYLSCLFVGHQ